VYRNDSSVISEVEFNPFGTVVQKEGPPPAHAAAEEDGSATTLHDLTRKPIREAVAEVEIHLLTKALESSRHNQKRAARLLGLSYHQFRGLYRKYKDLLAQ